MAAHLQALGGILDCCKECIDALATVKQIVLPLAFSLDAV